MSLHAPVCWMALWDTQEPADNDPIAVGTYAECAAVAEENPDMHLIWIDPDIGCMPSIAIH